MFNFSDFDVQALAPFFNAHPYASGLFTYFVVFLEALAVVGVIIPGSITMSAIGFLIGTNIIPAGNTFLWAIMGAITGDCISYWLGIYFQNRIHRIWPFTRWPELLTRSEKFFRNHGGKSVFIGRFVGPTRAMIPMVAGVFKMPVSQFLIAAIPSAAIWAVSYIIPGVLLGALSLELPAKVAAKFTFWALLAIVVVWSIIWLMQHFFKQIWQMLDYYVMHLWRYCHKNTKLRWFAKVLSDPKEPNNHQQLLLVMVVIFIFVLFLFILDQLLTAGVLVDLSRAFYYMFSSLRTKILDYIFILFTLFGELPVLIMGSGIVFLWFLWKRYYYAALHWLYVGALSVTIVTSMKFFMYSPRPGDVLYDAYASSFPSAHVVLSVSLYGFLAVIIARELKDGRKYFTYFLTGMLLAIIAVSRMYLGAHWLIDVLGGILLGLMMVLIVTISYRRQHVVRFPARKFAVVVSFVFVLVWGVYSVLQFGKQVRAYSLIWSQNVITFDQLVKSPVKEIPLYRLNRLGQPIEALNMVYVGDLAHIRKVLSKRGWEPQPVSLSLQNVIRGVSTDSVISHLPIFPQLYHNRKMALLFTKNTEQEGVVSILRLWSSDVDLKDSDLPLWVGSIEFHRMQPGIFSLSRYKNKRKFIGATVFLARDLASDFSLWKKSQPIKAQPSALKGLSWDGKLLVVMQKSKFRTGD